MVNLSEYRHCTLDLQLQFERALVSANLEGMSPVWLVTSSDDDDATFVKALEVFTRAGYRSIPSKDSRHGDWIAMVFRREGVRAQ
jgi:hypothetical protein